MVHVNEEESRQADGFDLVPEGEYHARVTKVEVRDEGTKFGLTFHEIGTGRYLARDWLTFAGKALGIAKKKSTILKVLPHGVGAFDLQGPEFEGHECKLYLAHEVNPQNGKVYARPGGKEDGYFFGYAEAPKAELSPSHPDAQPPDESGKTPF